MELFIALTFISLSCGIICGKIAPTAGDWIPEPMDLIIDIMKISHIEE
jgi:ABC-type dipeptide/oligopeptide/nickel transport system permease subunit